MQAAAGPACWWSVQSAPLPSEAGLRRHSASVSSVWSLLIPCVFPTVATIILFTICQSDKYIHTCIHAVSSARTHIIARVVCIYSMGGPKFGNFPPTFAMLYIFLHVSFVYLLPVLLYRAVFFLLLSNRSLNALDFLSCISTFPNLPFLVYDIAYLKYFKWLVWLDAILKLFSLHFIYLLVCGGMYVSGRAIRRWLPGIDSLSPSPLWVPGLRERAFTCSALLWVQIQLFKKINSLDFFFPTLVVLSCLDYTWKLLIVCKDLRNKF